MFIKSLIKISIYNIPFFEFDKKNINITYNLIVKKNIKVIFKIFKIFISIFKLLSYYYLFVNNLILAVVFIKINLLKFWLIF